MGETLDEEFPKGDERRIKNIDWIGHIYWKKVRQVH